MLILIMKNVANNRMYIVQELYTFYIHLKYLYKPFHFNVILSHQYFFYIFQIIYRLTFCCTYNFHNLYTLLCHMIYHIHMNSYQDSKYVFYHNYLYQSILYIHIFLRSIFVYYYKYLDLIYICIYKFYAILCASFYWYFKLD